MRGERVVTPDGPGVVEHETRYSVFVQLDRPAGSKRLGAARWYVRSAVRPDKLGGAKLAEGGGEC